MSSGKRPLYFRLLRVRHLRARPWVVFLLFEGSFGLGALLALAEIVTSWAIIAVPVAVAAMVKVNDVVTGAMLEPVAAAQLRAPGVVPKRVRGASPVSTPGRLTRDIDEDDAVADPAARPDPGNGAGLIARGVARMRYRGTAPLVEQRRPPMPHNLIPEPPMPEQEPLETIGSEDASGRGERRVRGNQGRFAD